MNVAGAGQRSTGQMKVAKQPANTGGAVKTGSTQAATTTQDTAQLSAAAMNPLGSMTTTQIEDKAFAAKDSATASMGVMFEGISGLPDKDRKAVGQSMFYETASATGYYTTEGDNGTRNMTASELREEAKGLSPDDRKGFEADVQGWASENEVLSQLSMAKGAAGWAADNFDENAPKERQDRINNIGNGALGTWNANNAILDSATELNRREPGRGTGLFDALNEPK